jgi:hypothetical protein
VYGVYLYHGQNAADDLMHRWREGGYVANGLDPVVVSQHGGPFLARYGALVPGDGYMPWAYTYGMVLACPLLPLAVVKAIYLLLNLGAILGTALVIRHMAVEQQKAASWVLIGAAALCCAAVPKCLMHANYGILITFFLWAFIYFESRGKSWAAGLFLALAMIKPQLGALFLLLPLVRGSYRTLSWCAGFGLAASGIAGWMLHSSPWSLALGEMNHVLAPDSMAAYGGHYLGIADPLKRVVDEHLLVRISGIIGAAVCLGLLFTFRRLNVWQLAAAPAVIATMWTYNRSHDLLIVSLLIAPMMALAPWRGNRMLLVAAVAAALTYWLPHMDRWYLDEYWAIPLGIRLVWGAGLVCFLIAAGATARGAGRRGAMPVEPALAGAGADAAGRRANCND